MPLSAPKLDDRNFKQLMDSAKERVRALCPEWSELSESDPGVVLLEAFAFLTETMIYRLNRIPEKAYIEFLRLLGVRLFPPYAAKVKLTISVAKSAAIDIEIPAGTKVTTARSESGSEPPVFRTAAPAKIAAGATSVDAFAYNWEMIENELVALGTGNAGLSIQVAHPPIVASGPGERDVIVKVQAGANELVERGTAVDLDGKTFRVWREVNNFAGMKNQFVYMVDRATGTVTFAPAVRMPGDDNTLAEAAEALAAKPASGSEIRVTYPHGGGPGGNVVAGTLTVIKDAALADVTVTNTERAVGGRAAETVQNAIMRGPQQLYSLQRAVTARDFELIAKTFGGIQRAKAFAQRDLWTYAAPGTVEVVLVPSLGTATTNPREITADLLRAQQTDELRKDVEDELGNRRPLGIRCIASWARYKKVLIRAKIETHPEEDVDAIRNRVLNRLYAMLSPVAVDSQPAWPFGQALSVSDVYDAGLRERGVRRVLSPRLIVEDVPENEVTCLAADCFQQETWYAGSGDSLFRSLNNGAGWELLRRFPGQRLHRVVPSPQRAGTVALCTQRAVGDGDSTIFVSENCGETWEQRAQLGLRFEDIAWVKRDDVLLLMIATTSGLYELQEGGTPKQVTVNPAAPDQGFYAVAAAPDPTGSVSVAVAAADQSGVFLSASGGKERTFRSLGLAGSDIRVLRTQTSGSQTFLWTGAAADDPDKGCKRWELLGVRDAPAGWERFNTNWIGGTCYALAFTADTLLAGTFDGGVLSLNLRDASGGWQQASIRSGLPQLSKDHPFETIQTLAAAPTGGRVMAGAPSGIYATEDAKTYINCSQPVFTEQVSLPPNWLFSSGEHQIEVTTVDEPESY